MKKERNKKRRRHRGGWGGGGGEGEGWGLGELGKHTDMQTDREKPGDTRKRSTYAGEMCRRLGHAAKGGHAN